MAFYGDKCNHFSPNNQKKVRFLLLLAGSILYLTIPNYNINILNYTIMTDIEQKVKDIIVEKLGVEESEVTMEASFTNDLGADSLDTVELIMEFEKEFGITIPDDQAEKIATVGDAVAYIEANQE